MAVLKRIWLYSPRRLLPKSSVIVFYVLCICVFSVGIKCFCVLPILSVLFYSSKLIIASFFSFIRRNFLKQRKAAVKIQATYRMHFQRKVYIKMRDEHREKKRREEEERRRQEEEQKRLKEEKRRQEEEKRRQEEEKRREGEEARRKAEKARNEAERKRKEMEEKVRKSLGSSNAHLTYLAFLFVPRQTTSCTNFNVFKLHSKNQTV